MEHINRLLLNVGCGNRYCEGFVNSDTRTHWRGNNYKLDLTMNLGEPWPYGDDSVDGIVGMHVFQQLSWRELVVAFSEAKRVLKLDGVLRMGVPMIEITDRPFDWLLGWNNINLFSSDLLRMVLVDRIGFSSFVQRGYRRGTPELYQLDNRRTRGTHYFEATK